MKEMTENDFAAERLRLEREAVALERERLAAERSRFEREMELKRNHPERSLVGFLTALLVTVVAFVGGYMLGASAQDRARQREYEQQLAEVLSRLNEPVNTTNDGKPRAVNLGAHTNVSIMVIH